MESYAQKLNFGRPADDPQKEVGILEKGEENLVKKSLYERAASQENIWLKGTAREKKKRKVLANLEMRRKMGYNCEKGGEKRMWGKVGPTNAERESRKKIILRVRRAEGKKGLTPGDLAKVSDKELRIERSVDLRVDSGSLQGDP